MAQAALKRSNSVGEASRAQIVATAEKLLASGGYADLSMRRVADACGISVGNLSYHFPSKAQLLEAIMAAIWERYLAEEVALDALTVGEPEDRLRHFIAFLLSDAASPDTRALFTELWAMAKRETFAARLVEQLYTHGIARIADYLKKDFPKSTAEDRKRAATFIFTMSEGSGVIFSHTGEHAIAPATFVDVSVAAVRTILSGENKKTHSEK